MRVAVLGATGKSGRALAGGPQKTRVSAAVRAAESFFELLVSADAGSIRDLFGRDISIDQPLWGPARGPGDLSLMVARAGGWLAKRDARVQHMITTATSSRAVAEQVLQITIDAQSIEVPVVVVAESSAGDVTSIRTYHSTWPFTRTHAERSRLLPRDPTVAPTDVVAAYQRALALGDVDGILAAFEDDGYVREPSGGPYVYRGKVCLREIYGTMFANGGGIRLEHCSLTDDGIRCAIEYNCASWGRTELAPQAGIAVYERGRSGLLAAARIYDDVDPPVVSD